MASVSDSVVSGIAMSTGRVTIQEALTCIHVCMDK